MPAATPSPCPPDAARQKELGQFFTPAWAAEILFDEYFSHLTSADCLWEPTCGRGNMLAAVPAHIPAFGSEIDPYWAAQAARQTGREVLVGDCCSVALPRPVTAVFGNPPFQLDVFSGLLERCASLLQNGQRAGFIIPAYFVQTSRTMLPWTHVWTMDQKILPRDLFPDLSKPLIFGLFTRDFTPRLVGFRLFPEMAAMREMTPETQERLRNGIRGPRSVWRETVAATIQELGGRADLQSIYRKLEGRRPTNNPAWREQIRKVVRDTRHFLCVGDGVYALPVAA